MTGLSNDARVLLAVFAKAGAPLFLPDALHAAFGADPWHVPDLLASSDLLAAGLLQVVGSGVYEITDAGRAER